MSLQVIYDLFHNSNGVTTDSRKVENGHLFFALKGERFDGNIFAEEVLSQGAIAAVIDDPKYHIAGGRTVLVDDVLIALQRLSTRYRQDFDIPVIAITGSNGKTTTKELLTAVLRKKYKVHATRGNYNNHIGVPLTLLQTPRDTQILVVEMGANHVGEIRDLCHIALPNYGMVTNIGQAHLKGFGSYTGVILAKTEMYRYIKEYGDLVFINQEDRVLVNNLPVEMKTQSYVSGLDFFNKGIYLGYQNEKKEEKLTQLSGSYNKDNILAAKTIGRYFEVPLDSIDEAIVSYQPTMNRSQYIELAQTSFILDAYNANPSSMRSAIDSFAQVQSDKPKALILGDMKELGDESESLHKEILLRLEQYEWSTVILVGKVFGMVAAGLAREEDAGIAYKCYPEIETLSNSKDEVLTMLSNKLSLVKASRSIGLERIVDLFS